MSSLISHALLLGTLVATAAAQTSPAASRTPATTPALAQSATGIPPITGQPKPLFTLRYTDIVVGTGPLAEPQKFYTVRYTGWLTDGTKFDSSDDHPGKEPITFAYGARRVIIGWDTGFEGMHVGGKRRLFIPYQLAYGETGRDPIPPKSDLIFDVELVSMSDTPPEPAPPSPTDATNAPGASAGTSSSTPPSKPETQPQS